LLLMVTLCHLVAGRDLEVPMKNPWTKKNPFMSMWLSGANAAMGSARGLAAAETKRQANALMAEGTKQIVNFWTGAITTTPATPAKRKKKRA
jgi:hypothetical protein